jgi:hypothetical protein
MNYYSNIYWHFTGSPKNIDWSSIFCPNDILKYGQIKSDKESLDILELIVKSKYLKASCKERIDREINSKSFCCVTDIPFQNLHEHTKYYGNIAIGFKHNKIHKEFNPVLYIDKNKLQTKLDTFTQPDVVNFGLLGSYNFKSDGTQELVRTPFFNIFLDSQIDGEQLGSYIFNYFKITNFSDNSSETFYREREWRKIGDFNFGYIDIAAIIVPSQHLTETTNKLSNLNVIDIPILSWDFILKI